MECMLRRRDEMFALDLFALVNNAVKPSRRIQAPTDCLPAVSERLARHARLDTRVDVMRETPPEVPRPRARGLL